jgi:hypothetical protein
MTVGNIKPVWLLDTTLLDNVSATIAYVDTLSNGVSFRQAVFIIRISATDIALLHLERREGDASGSGYTDITGTIAGAGGFALPTATDDNKTYLIEVSFKKRYLKLVITAGDGTLGATASALVILDNPQSAALADLLAGARGLTGQEVTGA